MFQRVGFDSSISVLPDDVLLEIFDFYRREDAPAWDHEGWYKLAHTSRRWRNIIFSCPSRLHVHLYCTYGSPVADMLSHSPPFPLIIDYDGRQPLSAKDEEGALLALQKHDRVRYIHLYASTTVLDKLFAAMNGPFLLLEDLELFIEHSNADEDESEGDKPGRPRLPQSFQAPHLRQLDLSRVGDVTEVRLPLLTSLISLVHLALVGIPTSSYLPLDYLASCLSLMPQLEYIGLVFEIYILSDDTAREPTDPPNVKQIPLPNLTGIFFQGDSSYLEGLAAQITAPHITTFNATFYDQPSSIPHLSDLLITAAGLRFPIACIKFPGTCIDDPNVAICMASSEQTLGRQSNFPPVRIVFPSRSLYAQVVSTGKICAALTPILSAVERLHLGFDGTRWWFPHERRIENARWHDLLRPFCQVEKLQVDATLWDLSLALSPNDNGPSSEILPQLRKILRSDDARFRDAFDGFIAARQDAGQHIVKRRRVPILYLDGKGSGRKEDEEDEKQGDDEGEIELGVGDEGENAQEGGSNVDTGSDIDPGFFTEIDSDSDFDSESKS